MSERATKTHAYIYLLREREFFLLDKKVYKLGMTIQVPSLRIGRFNAYKKDSELLLCIRCPVDKVAAVEQDAKRRFREVFEKHTDGSEFFIGNAIAMTKILTTLVEGAWTDVNDEDVAHVVDDEDNIDHIENVRRQEELKLAEAACMSRLVQIRSQLRQSEDMDAAPITSFLSAVCIRENGGRYEKNALYHMYANWAGDQPGVCSVLSPIMFSKALKDQTKPYLHSNGKYYLVDYRPRRENETPWRPRDR